MLRRRVLPWLAAAGALSACGPTQGAPLGTPVPTTPAASPTPSPSATPLPLIAVLDHPFGAAPNTLRLLRADGGGEVAHATLDPDAEAVATSGSQVVVAGSGQLRALGPHGTVVAEVSFPGGAELVRGLAGDPAGTHWLWATVAQAGGAATSTVYTGSQTATPAVVLSTAAPGRAMQPLTWTAAGPVVSEEPLGIGGYVLFRRTFGPAGLLDLGTRAVRPLTDAACAFSDMAADGSVACVLNGREAPNSGGPVTLRVMRPSRAALNVPLGASVAQAGAALFSPDGTTLSLATSPALGDGQEQVTMELVDVATGAHHAFGPAGLTPVAWLADGRLVAARLPGVAGGDVGTYMVDRSGAVTLISTASTVVGVLH
jgi:hypothetical protein